MLRRLYIALLMWLQRRLTEKLISALKIRPHELTARQIPVKVDLQADGMAVRYEETIKAIAVENIVDLRAYNMSTVDERTMHVMEFLDGARCEVAYTRDGRLEDLTGSSGCRLSLQPGGRIVIMKGDTVPIATAQ
jgi:hypothetical protein